MTEPGNIVVLTGAGISAESGLPTFRMQGATTIWEYDDDDGVRRGARIEDVCTPEALMADEPLVQRFYDGRRAALAGVEPNAAHRALARLDREWGGGLLLVTQNVDDLHARAGSRRMVQMHGSLLSALCRACDRRSPWSGPLADGPSCPACGAAGRLRPDIVFFGELPHAMDHIQAALAEADLFVSIGTSGSVYPAAGFVQMAAACGAETLELNLEASDGSVAFDRALTGPAGSLVPYWVDALLTGRRPSFDQQAIF